MSISTPAGAVRPASTTDGSALHTVLTHPLGRPVGALVLLLLVAFFTIPLADAWLALRPVSSFFG